MRLRANLKTILLAIAVIAVSFFVSLKAMDWLSPRGRVAAPVLAPAGATRASKDGGTFRMAITVGIFHAIDPALYGLESRILRPACAALMSYPDKPLPDGLRLAPELAASYPTVSRDRRTYTFTIRKGMRFSDGSRLTARNVAHALERIFDPRMRSGAAELFEDIVGAHQMPGRVLAVGRREHHVARPRVGVPALVGFHVHRAELPLT